MGGPELEIDTQTWAVFRQKASVWVIGVQTGQQVGKWQNAEKM